MSASSRRYITTKEAKTKILGHLVSANDEELQNLLASFNDGLDNYIVDDAQARYEDEREERERLGLDI